MKDRFRRTRRWRRAERLSGGRRVARAAALLIGASALAGCSAGVSTLSVPDPPATTVAPPAPPDTLPPGLASVAEAAVPGVTTTTAPAIGAGGATMAGTVLGPSGPVPGATVQIDRFVGDTFVSARTAAAADGSWSFARILGGRYRIRAWLAPGFDMATPQVLYLAAGQPQSVTLHVDAFKGPQVSVAINPAQPVDGQPASLVVQVTNPTVGPDGVLTNPPVVGAPVTLVDGPTWQVTNGNPITTDTGGQALFEVQCTSPGPAPLGAQVANAAPLVLKMPDCAPPPVTTVPTAPPDTSFGSGGAGAVTTTTCPTVPASTSPSDTSGTTTTTVLNFGGC